jgi:hypothetical protein
MLDSNPNTDNPLAQDGDVVFTRTVASSEKQSIIYEDAVAQNITQMQNLINEILMIVQNEDAGGSSFSSTQTSTQTSINDAMLVPSCEFIN